MAYKSSYTGPQIDQAVSHAVNMDVNPTAGHTDRVVSSGGVKSALNTVDESIAIRVSGNKTTYASGAAIGQYVIVDGSTITGITDGMYKAAKAIPYNTGIDSTYLTAVSGGGLNDVMSNIRGKTRTISGTANNQINIANGNDFATYRNPILCIYGDQAGNISIFAIFRNSNTLTVTPLHGAESLTAQISGNDIVVTGIGNWGTGIAIGR